MAPKLNPIPTWAYQSGRWRKQQAESVPVTSVATGQTSLTLLTWNVWFSAHRFHERTAALLDEISWRAPDVIALQEVTKDLLNILVQHPLIVDNYQLTDVDGSTFERYGVLLLSKLPFASAGVVGLPSQMGRRLLVGQLRNGLCVSTVHLESMEGSSPARVEQLGIIQPLLAAHAEDVVLMGDMNFSPEAQAETAALDPSFIDAWSKYLFAEPGYSVDSVRNQLRGKHGQRHKQERIDRVFVRSARWRVDSVTLTGTTPIDREGTFVSDHFGLEAVLSAKQG